MARQNVSIKGMSQDATQVDGEECAVEIEGKGQDLHIIIPGYLKCAGTPTKNGNLTIATTHGNVMLSNGLNFSLNLWKRTGAGSSRGNVTVK